MKFPKNNRIKAHYDFIFWYESLPAGVDFEVEEVPYGYRLRAFGYGELSEKRGAYGNGALSVYLMDLTEDQKELFRKRDQMTEWEIRARLRELTGEEGK